MPVEKPGEPAEKRVQIKKRKRSIYVGAAHALKGVMRRGCFLECA